MKLLNLTLLLGTLLLNTACDISVDGGDSSSGSKAGVKQLQNLAKDLNHFEDECPVLEGQYLTVWERDEYGTPIAYTTIYARSFVNAEGVNMMEAADNMEIIIDGKVHTTSYEGKTVTYVGGCENGKLNVVSATGRDFSEITYETNGTTLYFSAKGRDSEGNYDESLEAELDNDFVEQE